MEVTARLTRWVDAHFASGTAEQVLATLRTLPPEVVGGQNEERIQAALVILTGGDWRAFQNCLAMARVDWRDVLVGAGLGNLDWPQQLDAVLGD